MSPAGVARAICQAVLRRRSGRQAAGARQMNPEAVELRSGIDPSWIQAPAAGEPQNVLLGRIEDQLAPGVPRALPNSAQLEQLETQALLIPSRLALVPDRSFVANREGSNEPTVDDPRPSEEVDTADS